MRHQFDCIYRRFAGDAREEFSFGDFYGSAATNDFVGKQSDYNLLIALHEITPKDLRNGAGSDARVEQTRSSDSGLFYG
jgi:hypothetical protein